MNLKDDEVLRSTDEGHVMSGNPLGKWEEILAWVAFHAEPQS